MATLIQAGGNAVRSVSLPTGLEPESVPRDASLDPPSATPPSTNVSLQADESENVHIPGISPEELERIHMQAEESGFEEGLFKGKQEGLARIQEQADRLTALANELAERRNGFFDSLEDAVVEIVFEASLKVIGEQASKRDGIRELTRRILAQVQEKTATITIRLSPRDLEDLSAFVPSLQAEFGIQKVELVPDMRVSLGGCFIETARGTLDGRLVTQIERLKETLLAARSLASE